MKLTADNLETKMLIDGEMKTPIQALQDMLDHGDKYKSTWFVRRIMPAKKIIWLIVQDGLEGIVLKIYIDNPKQTRYWIIEKLIEWGFKPF